MINVSGNKLDILLKCVVLLHRENELSIQHDNSKDLVKTIISTMKDSRGKSLTGGETNVIDDLCNYLLNMINTSDAFDKDSIIQGMEIILKEKDNLIKNIEKQLNQDLTNNQLKRSIVSSRNALNNYYTDFKILNLISKANYILNTGRLEVNQTIKDYANTLVTNLESLNIESNEKDPGIVDEIDISNEDEMRNVLTKAKNQSTGIGKLRTGWKGLNAMTQGGFRRGETVLINALQHKYKSGFTQSLFMQLAMNNVPVMDDPEKKPLLIYISLEDDTEVYTAFMYKYLYFNEHKKMPDMKEITSDEMAKYIKDKLTKNGYHVKIFKVNPSEWSIKHLFNKILKLEANGYEIHACFVDYLAKLPTIGCTNTGPGGTEVRDMFNRCRNFFGSRKITFITPHQLSTEAKQLIRNGVPDVNFVKEIVGKGYFELSKQIDQVVDLELYIHIANVNRKPHLTVQRGKHRIDSILDEDKFYFLLPFPHKAPILEDVNNNSEDYTGTETTTGNIDDDFDFAA